MRSRRPGGPTSSSGRCAAVEVVGLEQPGKPEHVIGVVVGEGDQVELGESERRAQELALGALTAVDEQDVALAPDRGRRRRAGSRGRRSRRAEEDDLDIHEGSVADRARPPSSLRPTRTGTTRRSARERDGPGSHHPRAGTAPDATATSSDSSGTSRMICQARSRNSGSGTSSPRSAASARWPRLMAAPASRRAGSSHRRASCGAMIDVDVRPRIAAVRRLGDPPERLALADDVRRRGSERRRTDRPRAVRRRGTQERACRQRRAGVPSG